MFGWFIGWLDDLPAVWPLIDQIKYKNSDFLVSLYKRVCVCVCVCLVTAGATADAGRPQSGYSGDGSSFRPIVISATQPGQ
jgi:hypothetical protein